MTSTQQSGIELPVFGVGGHDTSHDNTTGVPLPWIDRNGRIIEKMPGSQTRSRIEKRIKQAHHAEAGRRGAHARVVAQTVVSGGKISGVELSDVFHIGILVFRHLQ